MINSSSKYATPTSSPESDDDASRRIKVLDDLNLQACSHINSFLTNYRKDDFELVDLNIDKQIEQLNPGYARQYVF